MPSCQVVVLFVASVVTTACRV